jgi:hypothetical protein
VTEAGRHLRGKAIDDALDPVFEVDQLMGEDYLVNGFEQSRTAFGVYPEGRIENEFGKLIFSVIGSGVCIHGEKELAGGAAWASSSSGKAGWDSRHCFGNSPLRPWRPLESAKQAWQF